jgi:flavodoxin
MKTVVVFYSLNGNCALVAEELKNQLNADLIRLHLINERKRSFIGSLIWGCGMVMLGRKPKLQPFTFDASAYDLIILGAPVWADSPAPPVKTFISQTNITGKKIALFVCHAGGKGASQKKLKALLAGNEIVAEADFKDPAKNSCEETKREIVEWAKGIVI